MKYIKYIISIFLALVVTNSCIKNDYELLDSSEPGFWFDLYVTSYVEATKDLNLDTLIYDSVYVSMQFVIPALTRDFTALELHKVVVNPEGAEIDDYVYASFVKSDLPLDTTFVAETVEELYEGLDFSADSMKPEYSIEYKAVMKLNDERELSYLYGDYKLIPALNGFCPLPDIPGGSWLAKNNGTLYTRTVEIQKPSPYMTEDDGRIWISDFGLDWSTWDDYWYSIEFQIKCPVGNDPRYVVVLMPDGIWDTGSTWTGIGRGGSEETKNVRIMPYAYADDEIVGHYDSDKQEITFEDVPLVDSWWGVDNHTVNLTFTYIGK